MTRGQFLNAVALGQVTPGPVVHTVAAVGYGAAGLGGGLLAAAVAFSPSFAFVLLGGGSFERLRDEPRRARPSWTAPGPAAIGAILGAAVPLARALTEDWQYAVLAGAAVLLLPGRRGVVLTLLAARRSSASRWRSRRAAAALGAAVRRSCRRGGARRSGRRSRVPSAGGCGRSVPVRRAVSAGSRGGGTSPTWCRTGGRSSRSSAGRRRLRGARARSASAGAAGGTGRARSRRARASSAHPPSTSPRGGAGSRHLQVLESVPARVVAVMVPGLTILRKVMSCQNVAPVLQGRRAKLRP